MVSIETTSGVFLDILMRDLKGRSVKPCRDLVSASARIPAGTVCRVTSTWRSSLSIETKVCGVSVRMNQVHKTSVLLVEEGDDS